MCFVLGNVDFVSADFDVAFLSTDLSPLAEQCVSIPIEDDTVALEGEESFAVELAVISQLPRVLMGNSSAVVAIQDNDCECSHSFFFFATAGKSICCHFFKRADPFAKHFRLQV